MTKSISGFSLVELSIVLVILGLLTGGILTGQNLIRAAELRSVVTEFQRYQTAMQTFRDKYFAVPGDMTNATEFWGAPGSNIANCPTTAGSGIETCNGNGSGFVDTTGNASEYTEMHLFWQHLANAGLIEGSYSGRAGVNSRMQVIAGENAPASKLNSAIWSALNRYASANASLYDGSWGNTFQLGAAVSNTSNLDPVLSPQETWGIDKKIDDGLPAKGKAVAIRWSSCTDATASDDFDSIYDLTRDDVACALMFPSNF